MILDPLGVPIVGANDEIEVLVRFKVNGVLAMSTRGSVVGPHGSIPIGLLRAVGPAALSEAAQLAARYIASLIEGTKRTARERLAQDQQQVTQQEESGDSVKEEPQNDGQG